MRRYANTSLLTYVLFSAAVIGQFGTGGCSAVARNCARSTGMRTTNGRFGRRLQKLVHLDSPATLEQLRRKTELEALEELHRIEEAARNAPPDPLERIVAEVASAYGVTAEAMRSPSRQRLVSRARATACWRATPEGIAKPDVVAQYFNRKPRYFNARKNKRPFLLSSALSKSSGHNNM